MMAYRASVVASLVMLLGIYLLALVQFVAAVAAAAWVASMLTGSAGNAVRLLLLFSLGATVVGLWQALRIQPEVPRGLTTTPDQVPDLWQLIQEISADVGTGAPDEIRLTSEVGASVTDEPRLLGLLGGTRRCYIGMPLLHALTVDQLRGVLAHELGHYSRRNSRLGEIAYRGRVVIVEAVGRIGSANPIGWSFKLYTRLYLSVDSLASSRRQELEADWSAVRVAGRDAAISGLKQLRILDTAWDFYVSRYVAAGWEGGYSPDDLFGGFGKMLAAQQCELDRLRANLPADSASIRDTHPALADRVARMAVAPETIHPLDHRSAAELVPEDGELAHGIQELASSCPRVRLPWPEFTHTVMTANLQRAADRVFREVCRLTDAPDAGLPQVFDLIAAGCLTEFATPLFPNATRRELPELFTAPMELLLNLAAVRSESARWRHSWSEPASLVDIHDVPLNLARPARLAVARETLDQARSWLDTAGIDISRATMVEHRATGAGARVIAGLANVQINGADHDLVLLDKGLVLLPDPNAGDGQSRLEQLVITQTPQELAAHNRFVAYEEVVDVAFTKRLPVKAQLRLHDGTILTLQERWTSVQMSRGSSKTLLSVLNRLRQS